MGSVIDGSVNICDCSERTYPHLSGRVASVALMDLPPVGRHPLGVSDGLRVVITRIARVGSMVEIHPGRRYEGAQCKCGIRGSEVKGVRRD